MKRLFKRAGCIFAAAMTAAVLLTGCSSGGGSSTVSGTSSSAAPKTAVKVTGIKGPTGVGLVDLWRAQENGTTLNDYAFYLAETAEEAKNRLVTGDADIAAVPTNVAAALYKATDKKVQLLAVNTLGVLHIVEKGDSVQTVADLRGRTIYIYGQGANPEYVLDHVLRKNGIDPDKDVTIEFVASNDELVTKLATDEQVQIAMLPEPSLTTARSKVSGLRVVLDMTEEWNKVAQDESRLMMGCVAVRTEFAEAHPEAVAAFLTEYQASIERAQADIDTTASLCESYGVIPKAAVAKQAIPNCHLTFVAGGEMKAQIAGYYQVLFDADPRSIGGALPDDGFYYGAQ